MAEEQSFKEILLFNKGQVLFVRIRLKSFPPFSLVRMDRKNFIRIFLMQDLNLIVQGRRRDTLNDCLCAIGYQKSKDTAKSINHAYTLISERYESYRRSRGGNVYREVYYRDSEEKLHPLNKRREEKIKEYRAQAGLTKPSPTFEMALWIAAHLHKNQRRKGTSIPYVSHLLAVAAIVMEHAGTEDEVIAALLHDAVEDQGGKHTLAKIKERFSEGIAKIVEECSVIEEKPEPSWKERKENFIAKAENASPSALLILSADKLHNARCILSDLAKEGEALWKRFNGGKDGTLWYYRSMTELLRRKRPSLVTEELFRVV